MCEPLKLIIYAKRTDHSVHTFANIYFHDAAKNR
jgi:hypothetical protein